MAPAQEIPAQDATLEPLHLHELEGITEECEPEDWCYQASEFGANYLRQAGIYADTDCDSEKIDEYGIKSGFQGWPHAWICLKDGTIVDPTVSQFSNMVDGWPHHPEVPSVALVPPGHPFADNYVGSNSL